ncbi:AMP-binding protein [Granulicoccus phenolivorans]|uniref:AMP-binding protein n=1 Tax=Granulicoccus phenolivorans TaxID=266854 RepID=UPI0004254773|nr:AMP-binding protein [Granulicoccus phenolivorans]
MNNAPALSYDAGPTDVPLLTQTLGESLSEAATRFGDREALVEVWTGRRWTYAELDAEVNRVARAVLALGLVPGDRAAVWSTNCAEWMITQYALTRLGIILVNLNPAYRTHELEFVLNHSGARALFAARDYKSSNYATMVDLIRTKVPTLEFVVHWGSPEGDVSTDPSWQQFLAGGDRVAQSEVDRVADQVHAEDAVNLQYTSGTTGFPKGATLTHRNLLNNGYFVGEGIALTEQDRLVIPVPYFHCFGMVMSTIASVTHGSTMILPRSTFEPASVLQAVQDEKATALHGVPTMFIAEQHLPNFADYDLSTLRTGIMAGSNCPVDTMSNCIELMHMSEVSICYGMTETSPVSTQTRGDDDMEQRTVTVGRVNPHIEIKIVDPQSGRTVPRGETGELCTRGYSVMREYWAAPELTAEAIDSDGWMHTGDLAQMRADGYVMIVGRMKDMVIRGGENIYPREIEEFYLTRPEIRDIQVVGVPDDTYGEELVALIQVAPGHTAPTLEEFRGFAENQLARFKIPRYLLTVEEYPMTVSGKVRKIELVEQALDRLGLHPHPSRHLI